MKEHVKVDDPKITPRPNCAKCKWFVPRLVELGQSSLCMAVGGSDATEIYGCAACVGLYEEKTEEEKEANWIKQETDKKSKREKKYQ